MIEKRLFTSESVSEGHPDKLADQISDSILDAILEQDNNARVACETFLTTERVVVGGEIKTTAKVDYEKIVRETLRNVGYTSSEIGIGCDTCKIDILLHEQSNDISIGVDKVDTTDIGAGDQGIMFGFAVNETDTLMPYPIVISHNIVKELTRLRKDGSFKNSRPDMKSQVTIDYTDLNNIKVDTVLVSVQHDEEYNEEEFKSYIEGVINNVLSSYNIDSSSFRLLINPTGRFVTGGPDGDSGLTGRKIIVDTYGGYSRHGGGAFSGKDSTKVDRSGAYISRYIAKNIVAAKLADKCEVQLSYAIGVSEPTSIMVDTFGTNKVDEEYILKAIRNTFDLTPSGIIKKLELDKPIYKGLSTYGHMGREDLNVNFEKTDMVDKLQEFISDNK